MTKTKPALHIKRGDKIVFTSQVSGAKRTDTVVKVVPDGDWMSVSFPAVKVALSDGKKVEVSPKVTLKIWANQQVEYEV